MYWENKGPDNTEATIQEALKRAQELHLNHLVVASSSGDTAKKLIGSNLQVVAVSYHVGFDKPGNKKISDASIEQLRQAGIPVLMTTHLLSGVERSVRNTFGGIYPAEIIAQTLRILGQGTKVCVEIAGMALDAGLIPYGEEIIAIGGSGRGADTAVVLEPAHSNQFFDTKIKEIICKPRNI